MSTHNDPNEQNLQPEDSGIKAKPVLTFIIVLAVATAFVFVLVKGLIYAFNKVDAQNQGQPSTLVQLPKGQTKLPPEPRLQGAPAPDPENKETGRQPSLLPLDEMKAYNRQINEKAASYGWVSKDAGVAHIPIERAKELIVEKGLPVVKTETLVSEVQKAENLRKQAMNADSNAGRTIK
jgi:hypothetical protein